MLARVLYAAVFVAVIPLVLLGWANALEGRVNLPQIRDPVSGSVIALAGVALTAWAMVALWRDGGGLPMNAFPPTRRVTRGPFAVVRHPIYTGFVLAVAGVSVAAGSSPGLWVITPASALGCAVLLWGYENDATTRRLGVPPPTALSPITGVFARVAGWAKPVAVGLARAAERIANSWREWRVGPLRVINHAAYAAIAAAVGSMICGVLLGPDARPWIPMLALVCLVGAALWGQVFVGAPSSLRPFGYFGAVLAGALGLACMGLMGETVWPLAAALAVAAPWVQAIGRLRCLVQGCCHGAPTDRPWAIRYRHPRSRVCRVAGLCGVGVHPTPCYSMIANAVIGAFLAVLWAQRAEASIIAGAYLILAGMARFVEEHTRGEPHTPVVRGLRVYQWFAIASVAAGISLSAIPTDGVPPIGPFDPATIAWSLIVGLVYGLAMGVDVLDSTRRFARLT